MVAMVTVLGGDEGTMNLLLVQRERTDEQGQVKNVDEGRKRHAVTLSLVTCVGCVCDSWSGQD
jgi:hypothetical protein